MDIKSLFVGGSGLAVSEVAGQAYIPDTLDYSEIVKVIVQIVIAVATLVGLFQRKNNNGSSQLKN